MTGLRGLLSDRRGATALEFALLGLPFVALILGILEFGRGLYIRNSLDAAADQAQRAVLIDPLIDVLELEETVRTAFGTWPSDNLTIDYSVETISGITYQLVSLDYSMRLLLPVPLGRSITIASSRRIATATQNR
ncbi:TadE/TadG family type IV pilus assembly protein [uncultured Jannaschia sp.]|uniref:TadE/TadG family type IV pilus assembly protein n=1 Tax=uncultured Jannaschia sp. TaxID=293347 RepID=UPI0026103EDC|nr:TadE/TadG family type IV pilus assembly protein [uncultured Jannaschia sp.]